jgi:hypothetical protein
MSQPSSPSNSGWRKASAIFSKEGLGVVSIVLGIVLSGINIYLFFNGSTKREVERLKATIEQLSLQPSFDVTYYAVQAQNPLGLVVAGTSTMTDVNHPLTHAKLLVDRRGKHFFLEDTEGTVPVEFVVQQTPDYATADSRVECSYFVVHLKYSGAVKLPAVHFHFDTFTGGNGLLPTLDTIQFVGDEGEAEVVKGLTRTDTDVEVANVVKDDAFFVPLTLGCTVYDDQNNAGAEFSYKKLGIPTRVTFHNPITDKDEAIEIRKMLNNAIINSAGVLERG